MGEGLLDGRFQIGELISKGSDGEVFRALDAQTGAQVALKMLRPSSADTNELLSRRLQEVKLLRKLDHPHAVRVIDANLTADNVFYVAMELLEGRTLKDTIADERPVAPEVASLYLDQLAQVLDVAHEMGIIHRDVRPQNVMIVSDPSGSETVKLLGFVFAKVQTGDAQQQAVTQAGVAIGSPSSMSPEQAMGKRLTKLSDVYSLAVTMYAALTGHFPFEERNDLQRMIAHVKSPIPRFVEKDKNLQVPAAVEEVVRWGMAKELTDRPISAGELARVFREAVANPDRIPERAQQVLDKRTKTDLTPDATRSQPKAKASAFENTGMIAVAAFFAILFGVLFAILLR